jgi:hypothetical protein
MVKKDIYRLVTGLGLLIIALVAIVFYSGDSNALRRRRTDSKPEPPMPSDAEDTEH